MLSELPNDIKQKVFRKLDISNRARLKTTSKDMADFVTKSGVLVGPVQAQIHPETFRINAPSNAAVDAVADALDAIDTYLALLAMQLRKSPFDASTTPRGMYTWLIADIQRMRTRYHIRRRNLYLTDFDYDSRNWELVARGKDGMRVRVRMIAPTPRDMNDVRLHGWFLEDTKVPEFHIGSAYPPPEFIPVRALSYGISSGWQYALVVTIKNKVYTTAMMQRYVKVMLALRDGFSLYSGGPFLGEVMEFSFPNVAKCKVCSVIRALVENGKLGGYIVTRR